MIVLIACLVVGVSCFLSLECVIKVTRKELLEWSNILLPFFSMHIFCNYKLSSQNRNILKKDIISQKICLKEILFFPKVILRGSALITYYDWPTTLLRKILIKISFDSSHYYGSLQCIWLSPWQRFAKCGFHTSWTNLGKNHVPTRYVFTSSYNRVEQNRK